MNSLKIFIPFFLVSITFLASEAQFPFTEEHFQVRNLNNSIFEASPIQLELEEWQKWKTVENYTFRKERGNMTMIADLNALHPYFRDQITELIKQCKAEGIHLAIVETFRTSSKQNEYHNLGKNYTRSSGGKSKHQYGLAADLVPIVNGCAEWHDTVLWKKIGIIGERLGLRWGGRWRRLFDPGHFEWTGGLTVTQLANGVYPQVSPKDYPCIEDDLKNLCSYWNAWETQQSTTAFETKEIATIGVAQ